MNGRPLPVTIIACIYIDTGAFGIAFHLNEFHAEGRPFQHDILWITLVRLLAVVAGAYMLRAANWARWLALLWMAFHVVLSAFHSLPEFAMHAVLFVVFAYFLLRPAANQYFGAR
jgi:hypothetical protein